MAGVWRPPVRVVWCGRVPYRTAWRWQRELAEARFDGRQDSDILLLMEHPPVYTMGRGGRAEHVPGGPAALRAAGADYVEVDRGGSVTYHGPGQLVGYPIVQLAGIEMDAIAYLRALEEALIDRCGLLGVEAFRDPPYTGVWHATGKLAAIGVRLNRRGITYHGFALNGQVDLAAFERIVPCGIEGRTAASLDRCGATGPCDPAALAPATAAFVAHALGLRPVDTTEGALELDRAEPAGTAPAR